MTDLARKADAHLRRQLARLNDGVVPFWDGRFARTDDRAALIARTHAEVSQLYDCFDRYDIDPTALADIGSGYGRLSPWLARRASVYIGVEPNDDARTRAQELYPSLSFAGGTVQGLPVGSDSKDVALTWTVLQHVPDEGAAAGLDELRRVVMGGGVIICCEKTAGDGSAVLFPRPVEWYADRLDGFDLVATEPRRTEGGATETHCDVMVFRRRP